MESGRFFRVLSIHVCAQFEQFFGRGETAPLDREKERRGVLGAGIDLGPIRHKQPDCGSIVVVGSSPQAVVRNGATLEEKFGELEVLAVANRVPEWRRLEVWLPEGFLIDVETGIQEHFGSLDTVGNTETPLF